MATIRLSAGVLPPPACGFRTEQERLEAFVAAMRAILSGGIQWETSAAIPADLDAYWLQTDSDGRPLRYRKHSSADGRFAPPLDSTFNCTATGSANAIILSNTIKFTAGLAFRTGMKFRFLAPGTNTGAVTLKVDDLEAKTLVKHGGAPLIAGDLVANQIVEACYNASDGYFEVVSSVPTELPQGETRRTLTGSVPGVGSATAIAHAGTGVPDEVEVVLRCTASDRSYSEGDEVDAEGCWYGAENTGYPAFTISRNATHVTIARASDVAVIWIGIKSGAGSAYVGNPGLDTSKWQLKVRCKWWPS